MSAEPAPTMPPLDAPMTVEALASLCKAGGDRLRLEVLRALRQDSLAVQELCTLFDTRQPAMSHHLKVLASAGLVIRRREGNCIYYRRPMTGPGTGPDNVQASLLDALDRVPLDGRLRRQLDRIKRARQASSRQFFRRNADKFRARQDLIASYDQYADTVAQVLGEAPLARRRLALEVGPGDGSFLRELSPRFERVVALDNAEEMLAQSRELAAGAKLENIEFVHGDTGHARLRTLEADCIVVNMVLHHTPSPAEIFRDLAGCLAGRGVLLVTDLCRHDQDWARESCGDIWLGFEPADLDAWATRAGLGEVAGVYLAQRNGFQVQVRLFGHPHSHEERIT